MSGGSGPTTPLTPPATPPVAEPTAPATLGLEPTALAVRAVGPWLLESVRDLDPATTRSLLPRMELAVHEACMNVVDHAQLTGGDQIELTLTRGPSGLTVHVRDPGAAFDPGLVPAPVAGQLQERGYGVKIVRSLVDRLTYRRVAGRNELGLIFNLGGTA